MSEQETKAMMAEIEEKIKELPESKRVELGAMLKGIAIGASVGIKKEA